MRGAHPQRHLEAHVAATLAPRAGETLLVAASGGPDSTALAALTSNAAARAGATAVLGHVNHGVRETSWRDEGVVLAVGVRLRLRVLTAAIDPRDGSEATLRHERYAALASLARRAGATRVCTAHHAEDQTETVLLALFRGSGPDGLAGMAPERPLETGTTLVRPLLRVTRTALRHYCLTQRLPYALDETNEDRSRSRNALRPMLETLRATFPRLDEAVARSAEIVRDERSASVRARVRSRLRTALAESGAGLRDVTFERLEAAARFVEGGNAGRVFLSEGVELTVRRG